MKQYWNFLHKNYAAKTKIHLNPCFNLSQMLQNIQAAFELSYFVFFWPKV